MSEPLNLMKGARPDEIFFLDPREPYVVDIKTTPFGRIVTWGPYFFQSIELGWFGGNAPTVRVLQRYTGVAKCDATRTDMNQRGDLGGTPEQQKCFVYTKTPKELSALRIHPVDRVPNWRNMGGA
jgi:hypothetical protein